MLTKGLRKKEEEGVKCSRNRKMGEDGEDEAEKIDDSAIEANESDDSAAEQTIIDESLDGEIIG